MSADTTKCCSTFRVVQITFLFRVFSASGKGGGWQVDISSIPRPPQFLILQFLFTMIHKSGRVVCLLSCVIVNTIQTVKEVRKEGGLGDAW